MTLLLTMSQIQPSLMICMQCRAFGYPDDRYCSFCGAPLHEQALQPERECHVCGTVRRHPVGFYCTRCGAVLQEKNMR